MNPRTFCLSEESQDPVKCHAMFCIQWLSRLMKDLTTYKFKTITPNHCKHQLKGKLGKISAMLRQKKFPALIHAMPWYLWSFPKPTDYWAALTTNPSGLGLHISSKNLSWPSQSGSFCVSHPSVGSRDCCFTCSPHPWFPEYLAHSWDSVKPLNWTEKIHRKL